MTVVRRTVRVSALVPTLVLFATLTACGDDGSEEPDAVETVTVQPSDAPTETAPPTVSAPTTTAAPTTSSAPTDGCADVPPAGSVTKPKAPVTYSTGSGGLEIELSDGTTDCVTFEAEDGDAGAWSVADYADELGIEFGSADAGLNLTLTDSFDVDDDEIAAGNGEPFTGIQYDGFYWADSFHSGCTVVVLELTDTSSAGSFDCSDLGGFEGGGWGGDASDVTIVRATGWWTAAA